MASSSGTLYIIATPIGNLQDISPRALYVLQQVQWIAAEDTRHSEYLLKHYGITTPLKSLHTHNEKQRIAWIREILQKGESVALVSDAGTPLISDPGYALVTTLADEGLPISPIPGACAVIAALSASGLPTEQFLFEGFLPSKSTQRRQQLEKRKQETATLIYYEAPHRLLDSLKDMLTIFGGNRQAVVARELTKTFEQFQRGSLQSIIDYFEMHEDKQRGECVILVHGVEEALSVDEKEANRILKILLPLMSLKQAAQAASEITGVRKNVLYEWALKEKNG